jgi:hypothetical protein
VEARLVLFCTLLKFVAALVIASFSASVVSAASIDQHRFPNHYPILLAFDLHDEDHPLAALIVMLPSGLPVQDFNISLPFKVSSESTNENGLFRLGRYSGWTLVTFSNTTNAWPQAIDFVPEIERSAEAFNSSQQGGNTIYLSSEGQIRRFRYRYPNANSSRSLAFVPSNFQVQNPDVIALALPEHSREFAVSAGQLSIPQRLVPQELVFPATTADPTLHFLEISYEVPATSFQKAVVKWGVKALGALLPIAGLFFLSSEQIRSPRLRRSLIWSGVALFVIVLVVIIWVASQTNDGGDVIGDLLLLLGSASISALIYWSKVQTHEQGGDVRVT